MVTLEPEDSQPAAPPAPRPVYFSAKSYAALVSTLAVLLAGAVFVLSLMFYPAAEGAQLRNDHDNHVEAAEAQAESVTEKLGEIEPAQQQVSRDVKTIKCLLTAKGTRAKNKCILED